MISCDHAGRVVGCCKCVVGCINRRVVNSHIHQVDRALLQHDPLVRCTNRYYNAPVDHASVGGPSCRLETFEQLERGRKLGMSPSNRLGTRISASPQRESPQRASPLLDGYGVSPGLVSGSLSPEKIDIYTEGERFFIRKKKGSPNKLKPLARGKENPVLRED